MDGSLDRLRKNIKKTSRKVREALKRTSKKVKSKKVHSKKVKKGSVKRTGKKVKGGSKKVHSKKVKGGSKRVPSKKNLIGGNRRKSSGRMTGGAAVTDVILNNFPDRPHICGSAEVFAGNLRRLQFVACIGSDAQVGNPFNERYRRGFDVVPPLPNIVLTPAQLNIVNPGMPGALFGSILGLISEIPQQATGFAPTKIGRDVAGNYLIPDIAGGGVNSLANNDYDTIKGPVIAAPIVAVPAAGIARTHTLRTARRILEANGFADPGAPAIAAAAAAALAGAANLVLNNIYQSVWRLSLNNKEVKVIYRTVIGGVNRYYITTHKGMSRTYFVQAR